jgi:hypothetical protein
VAVLALIPSAVVVAQALFEHSQKLCFCEGASGQTAFFEPSAPLLALFTYLKTPTNTFINTLFFSGNTRYIGVKYGSKA